MGWGPDPWPFPFYLRIALLHVHWQRSQQADWKEIRKKQELVGTSGGCNYHCLGSLGVLSINWYLMIIGWLLLRPHNDFLGSMDFGESQLPKDDVQMLWRMVGYGAIWTGQKKRRQRAYLRAVHGESSSDSWVSCGAANASLSRWVHMGFMVIIYTIWLFSSSPWKITIFKNGKPSISMVIII